MTFKVGNEKLLNNLPGTSEQNGHKIDTGSLSIDWMVAGLNGVAVDTKPRLINYPNSLRNLQTIKSP